MGMPIFDLTGLVLDPARPIGLQIVEGLRARIRSGKLPAASRLPASRELAQLLGVSRSTVLSAYEQLYSEGHLTATVGDGTYVAAQTPAPVAPATPPEAGTATEFDSQTAARLRALGDSPARPGPPRAFRAGVPAMDGFPFDTWARLHARYWRRAPAAQLGYAEPAGDPALRLRIAEYLSGARGLYCRPEQVLVTSGAQQAIALCAQMLLNPGDVAVVENPGYPRAAAAIALTGARLHGVAMDAHGMRTDSLPTGRRHRLAYVTPSNHYPTGVTLSLPRRLALLDWARAGRRWIIEDDYDGEYRYRGVPLPPLASLDESGRTIYVGTLSKMLFPGLRLGYMVVPPELAGPLAALRNHLDRHCSTSEQAVLAEFFAQGHFQRHVRRMRRAARARRDALLAAWDEHQPGGIAAPIIDAGLHAMLWLPSVSDERRWVAAAREADIELEPLERFWLPAAGDPPQGGVVLGFAGVGEAEIQAAVRTLAEVAASPAKRAARRA
jgi:GntR family transcriptional regulator/MocR family aminotransferase